MVKTKSINNRGQMNSPFELIVTMVIVTFVIILGSQVLLYAGDKVCENNIQNEMSEFKGFLEDSASGRSSKEFTFYPENPCFDPAKAIIKIEKLSKQKECSIVCGKPVDQCWRFIFNSNERSGNIFIERCLDLPGFTSFLWDSTNCPTTGEELDGFVALEPEKGLSMGNYILRNTASVGESLPKICIYYSPYK